MLNKIMNFQHIYDTKMVNQCQYVTHIKIRLINNFRHNIGFGFN